MKLLNAQFHDTLHHLLLGKHTITKHDTNQSAFPFVTPLSSFLFMPFFRCTYLTYTLVIRRLLSPGVHKSVIWSSATKSLLDKTLLKFKSPSIISLRNSLTLLETSNVGLLALCHYTVLRHCCAYFVAISMFVICCEQISITNSVADFIAMPLWRVCRV